jgi:hypothetical protein
MSELRDEIFDRKTAAENYLVQKRTLWDTLEDLFHGTLIDQPSASTKSQVFDHKLSTLLLEREYRVMAQMPTGKVKAIGKNDEATSKLMNLMLDKYIVPNANSQWDLLTKLRMIDRYSGLYGNFFALIDWKVGGTNGYTGPDMWLLNIRDVLPQVGAVSLEDSDYVLVRTWRPYSYFESLKGQKGYKNIDKILTKLKDNSGSKQSKDQRIKSKRELEAYPSASPASKSGYFEIVTQYEKDRWVDFCVDADLEFRDIDNPHDNDELPVVCKYSIPLLDDFMGLGDFERGAGMQNVVNSVWNLYLDAVKMSIYPPVLINKDKIASMSSIRWSPAAKWLVRGESINNTVQPLQLNPQGIPEFNNTYNAATASILNMFSTSDTAQTNNQEASMGKTPQALQMQAQRENSRDVSDRFFMEQFTKQVCKKMVNLMSKKQNSSVTVRVLGPEIQQLVRDFPDVKDMYDEKKGTLSIDKKTTGSVLYDYEMVSGSSYAADQKLQQQNLSMLVDMYIKSQTPNGNTLEMDLQKDGYAIHFGELFKQTIVGAGIQDWEKILEEMKPADAATAQMQPQTQQFQQMLQAAQANQIGQIPPQPSVQGVPPPPGQPMAAPPQAPGQPQMGQPPQGIPPQQAQMGQMPQQMPQQMGGMNGR